ncbi:MAG: site-specific DNA-methyltransferase [Clostridia bacterium]|nr:site-specific DNA-methyltransferase [Clostridia bacterium]
MSNLSQKKRERMLAFLDTIRQEHKDDDDVLIALGEIESELNAKKYGLVWEQHEEAVDVMMRTHIPVFTEDAGKEITTSAGGVYNFLLEGDNLHSLRLLEKTHRGRIDMIYIDPPYNTGETDFMYDDNYVDSADAYRHSKWLSFMKERLSLARNLLSESGVIFIQISDIELSQLKMLCDDVFGEDNFLNIISVNMKNIAGASGGGEDKRFKKNCEYIVVYAKQYTMMPLFNGPYVYTEISDLIQQYLDQGKSWKYTTVLVEPGEKVYYGSTVDGDGNEIKVYLRKNPVMMSIKQVAAADGISEKEAYQKYGVKIFQTTNAQSSIRTRIMDYRTEEGITEDLLSIEYVPKTGKNRGTMYEQFYKGDKCRLFVWLKDTSEVIDGELYKKDLQGTYWDMNAWMKNVTKEGGVEFANGKKPVALIKQIISLFPQTDITVLDFFAGSGTTGHAVLTLNSEDGGKRSFILCTNNENSICEEKTYQRLSNVINGYGKVAGIPANLKYYRTDFVPRDEEYLSDALLEHIAEMVQLEHGVRIDGQHYIMVMSDEEADALEQNWSNYTDVQAMYISKNVLFTSSQVSLFKDTAQFIIPDYYFNFELREEGETW